MALHTDISALKIVPYSDTDSDNGDPDTDSEVNDSITIAIPESQDEIRKRKRAQPELWKRNVAKRKRALGQRYVNKNGIEMKEKSPQRVDCSKCRYV